MSVENSTVTKDDTKGIYAPAQDTGFHADNTGSNPVGDAKDFQLLTSGFEGGGATAGNYERAYKQFPTFTVQSQFRFRFMIGQRTRPDF